MIKKLTQEKLIRRGGKPQLYGVFAVVKCEDCQNETEVCLAETTGNVASKLVKGWNKINETTI